MIRLYVVAALTANLAVLAQPVVAEESRRAFEAFKDCEVCPEMVFIPSGSFLMGSDRARDESPVHEVTVDEYAIGKYEVTFVEYDAFAEATGREKPGDEGWGRGNQPVINVVSADAEAYAAWLSEKTGKRYRLPTAAEWEYAARAGSTTAYPWGDEIGSNLANCNACGSRWDSTQSAPVGSFAPNAWGIHDTVGNVWEWTCSDYEKKYAGKEMICTDGEGGYRTTRGGSWRHTPFKARSTAISRVVPTVKFNRLGFRVVRIAE